MALKPGFSAPARLSVCVLVAIGLARQILPSQRVSEAVLDSERLFVRSRACFISAFAIARMVKRTHPCLRQKLESTAYCLPSSFFLLPSTSVFCLEGDSRRYILGAILKEGSA